MITSRSSATAAGIGYALVLAAAAHHIPASAFELVERQQFELQTAQANMSRGAFGWPWAPEETVPGQLRTYQVIGPNTDERASPWWYAGGDGVAFESTVQGAAVFYPDVARPFQAHSWAVASARTGHLTAHTHGTRFDQQSMTSLPGGITVPQVDGLWAAGSSAAQTINNWNIQLDRNTASLLPTQPLTFGLNLDVNTRYALNPENASYNTQPAALGHSTLEVSLTITRLTDWERTGTPEMPDGGPLAVTTSHAFRFDHTNQGRQTLRIEQSIDELLHFWIAPSNTLSLDGSTDLRARDCLNMRASTFWDNLCTVAVKADIRLFTESQTDIAEADVIATWDATINGSTAGIRRVETGAAQWGQPLNPLLASRPSLATPVPEAGVWWMALAGLGIVGLRHARGIGRRLTLRRPPMVVPPGISAVG